MYVYVPAMEFAAATVFMVWLWAWFWCVFGSPLDAKCWTEIYHLENLCTAQQFLQNHLITARLNEKISVFCTSFFFLETFFLPKYLTNVHEIRADWSADLHIRFSHFYARHQNTRFYKIPFCCSRVFFVVVSGQICRRTGGQTVWTFDLNRRFPALRTRLKWQRGFSVRSLRLWTRMKAYINSPVK